MNGLVNRTAVESLHSLDFSILDVGGVARVCIALDLDLDLVLCLFQFVVEVSELIFAELWCFEIVLERPDLLLNRFFLLSCLLLQCLTCLHD